MWNPSLPEAVGTSNPISVLYVTFGDCNIARWPLLSTDEVPFHFMTCIDLNSYQVRDNLENTFVDNLRLLLTTTASYFSSLKGIRLYSPFYCYLELFQGNRENKGKWSGTPNVALLLKYIGCIEACLRFLVTRLLVSSYKRRCRKCARSSAVSLCS